MAKKIRTVLTLQLPAGKADTGAAGRHRARPARHQHRRVLQSTTSGRRRRAARSSRLRSRSSRTAASASSSRRRRPRTCCARRPGSTRLVDDGRDKAGSVTRSQVREIAEQRWPISTRTTSRAPRRSSRARHVQWVSRWSASGTLATGHRDRTPRGTEGRLQVGAVSEGEHRMPERGKKYEQAAALVDRTKAYPPTTP